MADVTLLRTGHQQPSWADIPRDLAGMVLRLLPACADRARFAAVCPQWRAAARQLPLPPPLPLLALEDGTFFSLPYGKTFRFAGRSCADYKAAACGRWLVFPRDEGCFVVDPFTRATVTLPALSRIRLQPPNAVARYTQMGNSRIPHPFLTWMHIKDLKLEVALHKLILCSPNLVAAIFGSGPHAQILVCQPGASSWSVRTNDRCKCFEDMAFYQGKLYALAADDENLLVVNICQDPSTGDPEVSRIGQVIKGDLDPTVQAWLPDDAAKFVRKLYLVESCGTLLMVRRKVYCSSTGSMLLMAGHNEFEVFRADIKHSRWVRVTTLGDDQMIFLGRYYSRAVSASQYGISGDHIFFLDDDKVNMTDYLYDKESTSVGVYDMKTREVSSPLPMVWDHKMIHTAWLFPDD
ncbi:hypothetical protein PR202_gb20825 [Eleusine coracana subsp. coracana]|uniref:DUF295 domain-containing protein n=1 Tax=Eleusine coracana subsp. coracana TaxID=191504 RepID=A0AAV5FDI4_ELECO|nr:hypothetical protein QOZ80_7BG0599050 [Eleusine coracana subsp. coracana]GJN32325.1 hypothetical protein PR202_gb20825 [Eleusine coracana subsp. coracana]